MCRGSTFGGVYVPRIYSHVRWCCCRQQVSVAVSIVCSKVLRFLLESTCFHKFPDPLTLSKAFLWTTVWTSLPALWVNFRKTVFFLYAEIMATEICAMNVSSMPLPLLTFVGVYFHWVCSVLCGVCVIVVYVQYICNFSDGKVILNLSCWKSWIERKEE